MTTTLIKIEKDHFVATEQAIEALAHERYANSGSVARADGTYLRVLIVEAQSKLGRPRGRGAKPNAVDQAAVLETAHERFYAAVLRGVTTPDIAVNGDEMDAKERQRRSLERNRRSAFARSAKSTLALYVAGGGDLRTIDIGMVSKGSLRAAVAPPEPQDRTERQIARAQGALLRACTRKARGDPNEARGSIEAAIEALQGLLDQIDAQPAPVAAETRRAPRERVVQRTRVGVPQMHRGI